jgi:hypothetical protein
MPALWGTASYDRVLFRTQSGSPVQEACSSKPGIIGDLVNDDCQTTGWRLAALDSAVVRNERGEKEIFSGRAEY